MITNFNRIIEELKVKGIKVIKVPKTKPDTFQTYRITGSKYNPEALWTTLQIKWAFQRGEL